MIKVLHLISGGDTGGAKTHVFALIDGIKEYFNDEVKVSVGCFTKGEFYEQVKLKEGISTILFEQKNRGDFTVQKTIKEYISKEGFNIVHLHGARANFIVAPIAKQLNIPVITTVHSDYLLDFAGNPLKWILFTPMNVIALKKLDYYIAVSNSFKKMLINRGFMPNSIYTVYNGINVDKKISLSDKKDFAQKYGFEYDSNKKYICILTRFDRVKAVDVFIKGAAEICKMRNDTEFLIAGIGNEEKKLKSLVKKLNIESKVHFLGFVNDIYSLLNLSNINTLSSKNESFPYSLLEGALLAKPTVCTNAGGMPDMVIDGETGLLFKNGAYKDFADKCVTLLENPEMANELGENLKKRIYSKFSSKSFAQMNIDAYKSAIQSYGKEKKYDAVLSGYYGFDNSGDDALMFAITEGLKHYNKDLRIAVLAHKPKKLMLESGYDAYDRMNYFKIKKLFSRSRLLISGGGTLITDITSKRSLIYYLSVISLAIKNGMRTMIYGSGIGPVKAENRAIIKNVLDKVDAICVREELSLAELKDIGVSEKTPGILTADPALSLSPASKKSTEQLLKKYDLSQKSYFIVSLRRYSNSDYKSIAQVCDNISNDFGITPVFIPMKYPDDITAADLCRKYMKTPAKVIRQKYTVSEMISLVSESRFVLSMRLHTLVYAASSKIPCLGISDDPKLKAFLDYCGINHHINLKALNKDELYKLACKAILDAEDIDKNRIEELKKMSYKNAEIAITLLDNKAINN